MTRGVRHVFADTSFWIAIVVRSDRFHLEARMWSGQISGTIFTTEAVLLETANALSRQPSRRPVINLFNQIYASGKIEVVSFTPELWSRGVKLFEARPDKDWSLTDCISFEMMRDLGLTDALTTDRHFQQASFRSLMSDKAQR